MVVIKKEDCQGKRGVTKKRKERGSCGGNSGRNRGVLAKKTHVKVSPAVQYESTVWEGKRGKGNWKPLLKNNGEGRIVRSKRTPHGEKTKGLNKRKKRRQSPQRKLSRRTSTFEKKKKPLKTN